MSSHNTRSVYFGEALPSLISGPATRMSTLTQPQFAATSTPASDSDTEPRAMPLQPDASIVIVSFNTREVLRECLESISREAAGFSIEILIVDNNSSDGSQAMIEAEYPGVILVRSPKNLGFGAANNVALEQASGRYLILLNSDAFFAPGALATAVRHMDATPTCGLGGGRLVGRDGALQPSARKVHSIVDDALVMTGLASKFPQSKFFGRFDRTWADSMQAAEVDWVPGAFSIIRPEALKKVGLFDPAFFLYYEEVDLCRRIQSAGYSIWYWPDIVVIHLGGESSKKLTDLTFSPRAAQVSLWRMRSTLLYYRKHHGFQARLAFWLETGLYRITVWRNSFAKDPVRQERARHYKTLIALMHQAWRETNGGRVSPPTPW
jgi:GT2 family glycosyltransferase